MEILESFETLQVVLEVPPLGGDPPSPPAGAGTDGMVGLAALRGVAGPMLLGQALL